MAEADELDIPLPGELAAAAEMDTTPEKKEEPKSIVPAKKLQPTLVSMLNGKPKPTKRKANADLAATPEKKAKVEEEEEVKIVKKPKTKLIKLEDAENDKEVAEDAKELNGQSELEAMKAQIARLEKEKKALESKDKVIAKVAKKTKKRQADKKQKKGSEYIDDEAADAGDDEEETDDDEEKQARKADSDFVAPEDDGTKITAEPGEDDEEDENENADMETTEADADLEEAEAHVKDLKERAKKEGAKTKGKMCMECETVIPSGWRQDRIDGGKKWGYFHDGECWETHLSKPRETTKPAAKGKGKGKGKPTAKEEKAAVPVKPTKAQIKAKLRERLEKVKAGYPLAMTECFKDVLAGKNFNGISEFIESFLHDTEALCAWGIKHKKDKKAPPPTNFKLEKNATAALPLFFAVTHPEGFVSMIDLINKAYA